MTTTAEAPVYREIERMKRKLGEAQHALKEARTFLPDDGDHPFAPDLRPKVRSRSARHPPFGSGRG